MAAPALFVYGTLKEGFRNFAVMRGVRRPGSFVTVQRYPMYVIGEWGLPWLVDDPGQGHPVLGHVFDVDDDVLGAMDAFERVSEPQWYTRREITVRPLEGTDAITAQAYFGSAERLAFERVHHGPLPEYLPAHQALYRKHL
jgi:gamma-glutamylaminecyclotransferase